MTTTEIQTKIAELEGALAQPGQYPTEIYTRIVGYYRSLANWNAGKREEYDHRVTFAEDDARIQGALAKAQARFATIAADAAAAEACAAGPAVDYLVFVQDRCPNCPAMKARLPLLPFEGTQVDVASEAGFDLAAKWEVTATPTLLLLDAQGREVTRILNASDWKQIEAVI